jgi:hypothetical protein
MRSNVAGRLGQQSIVRIFVVAFCSAKGRGNATFRERKATLAFRPMLSQRSGVANQEKTPQARPAGSFVDGLGTTPSGDDAVATEQKLTADFGRAGDYSRGRIAPVKPL